MHGPFERIAADLTGMPVSHLWRGFGSAIFLELGELSPGKQRRDGSYGNPVGQLGVYLWADWRIEDEGSIVCGSSGDDGLWELSFDRIRRAYITGARTFGRLPEIDIEFGGGLRLLSFAAEEGQPDWSIVDRRDASPVWLGVRGGEVVEGDGGPEDG